MNRFLFQLQNFPENEVSTLPSGVSDHCSRIGNGQFTQVEWCDSRNGVQPSAAIDHLRLLRESGVELSQFVYGELEPNQDHPQFAQPYLMLAASQDIREIAEIIIAKLRPIIDHFVIERARNDAKFVCVRVNTQVFAGATAEEIHAEGVRVSNAIHEILKQSGIHSTEHGISMKLG